MDQPPQGPKPSLAEAVSAALLRARDKQPVLFQIVFDDGTMTQITATRLAALSPAVGPAARTDGATDTEQAILRVLQAADKPLKKATIASRADLVFNSYFKQTVTNLVKKGTVRPVDKCWYWLASRPLPPDLPAPGK